MTNYAVHVVQRFLNFFLLVIELSNEILNICQNNFLIFNRQNVVERIKIILTYEDMFRV